MSPKCSTFRREEPRPAIRDTSHVSRLHPAPPFVAARVTFTPTESTWHHLYTMREWQRAIQGGAEFATPCTKRERHAQIPVQKGEFRWGRAHEQARAQARATEQ
jgi:hypothetical protein